MFVEINFEKVLERCPSQEEVTYHRNKSVDIFNTHIVNFVEQFMSSNEETTSITENEFEDTWIFALVMGLCGSNYYKTRTGIAYGRSDGCNCASIIIINKDVKLERLNNELERLKEKMKNMDSTSSKYEKAVDKLNKILEEIEKLK